MTKPIKVLNIYHSQETALAQVCGAWVGYRLPKSDQYIVRHNSDTRTLINLHTQQEPGTKKTPAEQMREMVEALDEGGAGAMFGKNGFDPKGFDSVAEVVRLCGGRWRGFGDLLWNQVSKQYHLLLGMQSLPIPLVKGGPAFYAKRLGKDGLPMEGDTLYYEFDSAGRSQHGARFPVPEIGVIQLARIGTVSDTGLVVQGWMPMCVQVGVGVEPRAGWAKHLEFRRWKKGELAKVLPKPPGPI